MQKSRLPLSLLSVALLASCTFSLDRALTPGEIRGRIVVQTPSGTAPATGADVRISNSVVDVQTDAQGRFVIRNLGAGQYSLSVVYALPSAGHPDSILSVPVSLTAGDGMDIGTIQLAVAGSVKGTVYLNGSSGLRVANASLTVVDGNGVPVQGIPVARSDGLGNYNLPYALAGTAVVKAVYAFTQEDGSQVTQSALSQPIMVQPRQLSTADIVLTNPIPAKTGSIVAAATASTPIKTVTATLTGGPLGSPLVLPNLSPDPIVIPSVPAGIYTLTVTTNGLEPSVVQNVTVDGDVNLGTIVFSQAATAGQATDCNDNGVLSCSCDISNMTAACTPAVSGCDTDDDSDGIPDAMEDAACLCRAGGRLEPDGSCGPLDPCQGVMCDPLATCSAPDGFATCTCPAGYSGDGVTCTDIDECTSGTAGCDTHATCTNTPGSFTCMCNMGYSGDGKTCLDEMSCEDGTATCDPNATCTDSPGSYSCACKTGFSGDGKVCTDVDECALKTDNCSANATCTNTTGSFTCACNPGYMGDGVTCTPIGPTFLRFSVSPSTIMKGSQLRGVFAQIGLDQQIPTTSITVQLQGSSTPWQCTTNEVPGSYSCRYTLQGTEAPMGVLTMLTVTAQATGANGGVSTDTATLTFDYRPQLSIRAGTVQYVREPHGNGTQETLGSIAVPAGPFFALTGPDVFADGGYSPPTTIAAGSFALDTTPPQSVNVWADSAGTQRIGTATPDSDGGWPVITLTTTDVPAVYVSAVDSSNNESAPQKVPLIEYVATPNDPGSPMTSIINVGPTLTPAAGASAPVSGPFGLSQNGGVATLSDHWISRTAGGTLPARTSDAMAYDFGRDRIVRFGGVDANNAYPQDVYEFDGQQWTQIMPTGTVPPGRTGHQLVYNPSRGRIVLFGGQDATGTLLNDIWEWNGQTWKKVMPQGSVPTPRKNAALAYDAMNNELVLFGGNTGTAQQETWTFDGANWSPQFPSVLPPARSLHAMAYDPIANKTVLYGGVDGSNAPLRDTWTWASGTWTQVFTDGSPSQSSEVSMTFDWQIGQVIIFGGFNGSGSDQSMWGFQNGQWLSLSVQVLGSTPPARRGATLIHDSVRNRDVLAGGYDLANSTPTPFADTWSSLSATWTDITPSSAAPAQRSGQSVVFDSLHNVTLVFGGTDLSTGMLLNDTWQWDGVRWTNVTPASGMSPPARRHAAMEFDTGSNIAVLYGGEGAGQTALQDVWHWSNGAWTNVTPSAGNMPTACCNVAAAFDQSTGESYFFGGSDVTGQTLSQEVWTWNTGDASWSDLAPSGGATPRWGAAMAYSSQNSNALVFGGNVGGAMPAAQDFWMFSDGSWNALTPTDMPGAVYQAALSDWPSTIGVVLFGGLDGTGQEAAPLEWVWNASDWSSVQTPTAPQPRYDHGMVYDTSRQVSVLFGGQSAATPSGFPEVWELNPENTKPALQFDANFGLAGIQASQISGVIVRAFCAGTSVSDSTVNGAQLSVWNTGAGSNSPPEWLNLSVSNSAGASAMPPYNTDTSHPVIWASSSPSDIEGALQSADVRMSFQCTPFRGGRSAIAAANYIEARVQYAAP